MMTDHGHYFAVYSQTGVHIGLWQDGKFAAEVQSEHPGNTITELVRADIHQTALDDLEKARAEAARMRERLEAKSSFESADWYWRVMDPDDSGDSPEEAVNRAMLGRFCVCEIASGFTGPVRYGFIAPVLDPESDDEEFVHFDTHQEAMDAAKARAALTPAQEG